MSTTRGRVRGGWTKPRTDALRSLMAMGASPEEIAVALGRSLASVSAKIASLDGVYDDRAALARERAGQRPEPRKNNCAKHLALIGCANNGKGFPVVSIPLSIRRAA